MAVGLVVSGSKPVEEAPVWAARDATGQLPRTESGIAAKTSRRSLSLAGVGVTVAIVLAGWVRLQGLGEPSLTHAEAWRANWSHHGSWSEARRLPPLQYALLAGIQRHIGRGELSLRLPSAVAGILCVGLASILVWRHIGAASGALVAWLAAAHPVLIEQSRLLKVFSLESFWTVAILGCGVTAWRRRTSASLAVFTLVSLVALAMTFSSAFLIAGWAPVLAWGWLGAARDPWRTGSRSNDSEGRPASRIDARAPEAWSPARFAVRVKGSPGYAPAAVLMALAVLGVGGGVWYAWLSGAPSRDSATDYFASVEPAWPVDFTPEALASWAIRSGAGAAKYTLGVSDLTGRLSWVVGTLSVFAAVAGLPILWKHWRPAFVATVLSLAVVIIAGATRLYPFGEFRTVTFLVPCVVMAIGCGAVELARGQIRSPATLLLVGVCAGLPMTKAVQGALEPPALVEHLRPVVDYVKSQRHPDDAIFVYYASADAVEFYWPDPEAPMLVEPRSDRGDPEAFLNRFAEWIGEHGRVWFVSAHPWRDERNEWVARLAAKYRLADRFTVGDAAAHLLQRD